MLNLWKFSITYYAMNGVADACISLQDRRGVDVNLLLFALWEGYCRGRLLEEADIARAKEQTQSWRTEIVQPLRTLRRQLKSQTHQEFHPEAAAVRLRVKEVELHAERLQQEYLERTAGVPAAPQELAGVESALRNLAALLAFERIPVGVVEFAVLREALRTFPSARESAHTRELQIPR